MSEARPPQNPSTEELIASISRLIGEDGRMREPVLPPVAGQDDILELTDRLDDAAERPATVEPPMVTAGAGAPTPPTPPHRDPAAAPDRERGPLISEAASRLTGSSFARLGPLASNRRGGTELPIGGDGRTVEDIVREALQPLLRAWLDAHLPTIVERLVREEIVRITGETGLR